ncbi:O-antigen ligase family protein, partial [Chloroflexota bacterium]
MNVSFGPSHDFALWGTTLLLVLAIVLWRWLRQRQAPHLLSTLGSVVLIVASTALTQNALATGRALSEAAPIHMQPDLSPVYLACHYCLVIWLVLGDALPPVSRLPPIWPFFLLYSSYFYFRTFFALELGATYPILYVLAIGYFLVQRWRSSSTTRSTPTGVSWSLFVFLLLMGIGTAVSAAPGDSLSQYLQIVAFALLPLLLARDLTDNEVWRRVAIWAVILNGVAFALLAFAKFGIVARDLGVMQALHYRLFTPAGGANLLSRPLAAVLPLSISLMLTVRGRREKWLWRVAIIGMILGLAYTQSTTGYSGWMALVLGVGALALLLGWPAIDKWCRRQTPRRLLALALGAGLVICAVSVAGALATRINSFSFYSRLYGWRVLLHQVLDHPLFGSGPAVRHITAQYGDLVMWEDAGGKSSWLLHDPLMLRLQKLQLSFHAHSLFLEIAVGAGLAAVLAFFWFLWELAKHGLAALHQATGSARPLIAGCMAGILATLAWGLIDVAEFSPPFFTTPTWVL